jgi:hypothetical protein
MVLPRASSVYPTCPPASEGARTDVVDVEGGVALDVTGNDVRAAAAIASRTRALLEIVATGRSEIRHTGDGDGPGLGRCPVVVHDAVVTATPIDRGMRILVTTGPEEVAWLRRETRDRLVELRVPTPLEGLGMDHCPSALPSATTEVRDVDGGVVVTVLSRDPEVAEAIRGRARHLALESRKPGAHAEHAPSSTAQRACPVVLVDSVVEPREIPGGVEITVRARLAAEADALRRAAHARAQAFR